VLKPFFRIKAMYDEDNLREQLEDYRRQHRQVDEQIEVLSRVQPVDFLHITKLKKEKLRLKDLIQKIESSLIPDIIA
jgi:hypothetical protein